MSARRGRSGRRPAILATVLLILGTPWAEAQGPGSALRDSAFAALRANRFQEAARRLETLANEAPADLELRYWLGFAHWEAGTAETSIAAYKRVVALDSNAESPWSLYALENLAEVYGRNDYLKESERAYTAALQRETRPAWRMKIESQLEELALTRGTFVPNAQTVLNDRGQVVGGIGPHRMRTNQNFEIARHTQDPSKQETYYRLAVETDPTMFQSYFNLGLALVAQERYKEAIPWFLESDKVFKEDKDANPSGKDKADAHAFLSRCYLELGRLNKARKHAEISLKADPDYFWGILFAQRIRAASGEAQEAVSVLRSLARGNPEHKEVQSALEEATRAVEAGRNDLR